MFPISQISKKIYFLEKGVELNMCMPRPYQKFYSFAIMYAMERIYLVSHEILNPFLKANKIQKQTVELSYLPKTK